MSFRNIFVGTIGWVCLASLAHAESVVLDYSFERPVLTRVTFEDVTYDRVTIPGLPNCGNAGQPALPAQGCQILLPFGTEVTNVRVIADDEVALGDGYLIEPVGAPIPLTGEPAVGAGRKPDAAIYASDQPFPHVLFQEIGTQSMRGYQILVLKLQPVRYVPASGALSYYPRLTVEVDTVAADPAVSLYRGLAQDQAAIRARVDNPAVVGSYPASAPRDGEGFGMLILAPPWLADAFIPLKDYHDAHGLATEIHTTDDVGSFDPHDVRDYIRERYLNDGIEYVLIGSDDDVIRALDTYVVAYAGGPVASDMPTDLYFACLDGTWNYDGDDYWGEPTDGEGGGDVDMMAEVYVGRASADSEEEVTRFVDKTLWYLNGYHTHPEVALMVGEYLGWYGGPLYGGDYIDELIDGSSANGYTTVGISSDDYEIETLYDRDWPGGSWAQTELITRINGGLHILNHLGHGNVDQAMRLYNADILNSLTNDDLCLIYSQTCLAGHFDGLDCWAELMNVKTDYGAFAVIMNARYGWGVTEGTDGASQRFQREFWDAVFAEGMPELGRANHDSKEDNIYRINDECMRWCAYELTLFGDPSIGVRRSCVTAGTVVLDRPKYACESTAHIFVNDCGLNTDDYLVESVVVDVDSDSETGVEQLTLIETDPASAKFGGSIPISLSDDAGVLLVAEGDTVTITYVDADDGHGGTGIVVTATAVVDCTPPEVSNVHDENVDPRHATIIFECDEPSRPTIHFGTSCGTLSESVSGTDYSTTPAVPLTGIYDGLTYFYAVEAEDQAGNVIVDDNGGSCYTFTTPEVPDYFTEMFEPNGNDLESKSFTFVPDGGIDYYAVWVEEITELPTDSTGGTLIEFPYGSGYSFVQVMLNAGSTVSLYGTSYDTFYVGTNGYLTFGSGDTNSSESLAQHFALPRVSALFDDLSPSMGGTVSWMDCGDWVAVTYEDVPEVSTENSNTFQIEMFANGTIRLSYLSLDAVDGLAGLSAGTGTPTYFYESNLSNLGSSSPRPPRVRNIVTSTAVDVPLTVTLAAFDEGLPDPPAALTYFVTSLPEYGQLSDPLAGAIGTAPYTLTSGGNQVFYEPDSRYYGPDLFHFKANDGGTSPDGGDSVVSPVMLMVGGPDWDPVADDQVWNTPLSTPGTITLTASDPNNDTLTYVIETLPALGTLSDPAAGVIETVPHTLVGGGSAVHYEPPFGRNLVAPFTFSAWDATIGSAPATVTVNVGGPDVMYGYPLDANPGWAISGGQWAFGEPAGNGGTYYGYPDPDAGATGTNVYGVNLNGDYSINPTGPHYVTVGPLNFTGVEDVTLKFQRWLNTDVRTYAHATIQVSNNGVDWTLVWENPTSPLTDEAWTEQVYDLSAVADHAPGVYVRWGYQIKSCAYPYSGWNLDDVELWGMDVEPDEGDLDGDSDVDMDDFGIVANCMSGPQIPCAPECIRADADADGDVDLTDFGYFQQIIADGLP